MPNYRELEQRLYNYTDGWTKYDGAFPVETKKDKENAEAILKNHYSDVDTNHLDYENKHVDGTDYRIEFDEALEGEDERFDRIYNSISKSIEDEDRAVEEAYKKEKKKHKSDELQFMPEFNPTLINASQQATVTNPGGAMSMGESYDLPDLETFREYCSDKFTDLGTVEYYNYSGYPEEAKVLMIVDIGDYDDVQIISDEYDALIGVKDKEIVFDTDTTDPATFALSMDFKEIDNDFYDELIENMGDMLVESLDEAVENPQCLSDLVKDIDLIYYYDDINSSHFYESLDEDLPWEEDILSMPDEWLSKLSSNDISEITNIELLDRLAQIDKSKLTQHQLCLLKDTYSKKIIISKDDINNLLNGLKMCNTLLIADRPKNRSFREKYDLDNNELLEIVHRLKVNDYIHSTRDFNLEHFGNNLIVFIMKNVVLSSGKSLGDVCIYIKINLSKSDNSTIAMISFHDAIDNKEHPYLDEAVEKHSELNPDLWDDKELKPEVKEKLMEIAEKFRENLAQDNIELDIIDEVIVGSNANYNYNATSDIDLHIVADTSVYKDCRELAAKLYEAYKRLWNNKYDPTIYGHEVEIYVEPDGLKVNSNGIYSLTTGWIKAPKHEIIPDVDQSELDARVETWADKISEAETLEEIDDIIDELYIMRQQGILANGEFDLDNLTFKEIRSRGLLQELRDKKVDLETEEMSL